MVDLRGWLKQVQEIGELKTVCKANPLLEIGTLTEINNYQRGPALLFKDIQGYSSSYQLISSALVTSSRLGITLGLNQTNSPKNLLSQLEGKPHQWSSNSSKYQPEIVKSGTVMENTVSGLDVDLLQFPAPLWNDQDGGRYLGTGDIVVTRDLESDISNIGTYRVMVHDKRKLGLYISPSHQGYRHLKMYQSKGIPCPIAVSFGHHPVFLVVGGSSLPYGHSEYNYAGAILERSLEVIECPITGLPVPAHSELIAEGFIAPNQMLPEGPFGEYTGYYATGKQLAPVIEVEAIYYRNNPIILGALACKPPHDFSFMSSVMKSLLVKEALVNAGIPEVCGVWFHEAAASNFFVVVSIKQLYGGHARQAGIIAAQCEVSATGNGRYVVVVDEDIDPTNLEEVLWALGTRSNPTEDISTLHQTFSNKLDPLAPADGKKWDSSRAIIDACRPFDRLEDFPSVARATEESKNKVREKWPEFK